MAEPRQRLLTQPAPLSVLIVEDDAVAAIELQRVLASSGHYLTMLADTVAQAFRVVSELRPDVACLRVTPGSRAQAIQRAHDLWEAYRIPAILLCAGEDLHGLALRGGTGRAGRSAKVLIVEEEPLLGAVIQAALSRVSPCITAVANSPRQAVAVAAELNPDLAMLCISLPGGLDAIGIADELWSKFRVPTLLFSNHFHPVFREQFSLLREKIAPTLSPAVLGVALAQASCLAANSGPERHTGIAGSTF